ncbi:MAG: DUF1330 domain-containing protein [Bacteroidota bacterium]
MNQSTYVHPSPKAGQQFYLEHHGKGQIVMLNLLKFRAIADYIDAPHLAPKAEISGAAAYQLYAKYTLPLLEKAGSKTLFFGKCSPFMIGPEAEKWDAMLLVQHESAERFIAFAQDEEYLKIAGHRTAALEDSRLLPMVKSSLL